MDILVKRLAFVYEVVFSMTLESFYRTVGRIQLEQSRIIPGKFNHRKPFPGYSRVNSIGEYTIYQSKLQGFSIEAAFDDFIVTRKKNTILIYPDYRNTVVHYKVRLESKSFPGLIPDSNILCCLVLPFMREVNRDRFYKRYRVVVITDKCQVFHNFPDRDLEYAGYEIIGDIIRFEESEVWDIPGRKYPANNTSINTSIEYYAPWLPNSSFEYHPSKDSVSKYSGKKRNNKTTVKISGRDVVVSRFYFPQRTKEANPFSRMLGFECDEKIALIGTYCANKEIGARTIIFASSDGGRNWYAKYEFADEGTYEFKQGNDVWGHNVGNPVDTSSFGNDFNGNAYLRIRYLNHNNEKKSTESFILSDQLKIRSITCSCPARLILENDENLCDGNIIVLYGKSDNIKWNSIFNNSFSEDNAGNGVIFKAIKCGNNEIELYECVSNPYNNIACRHIHHINRVRDGWIVGTGEIYPNGWTFYIQMKEADTFSRFSAADELKIIRLTSRINSVQRTVGMDWDDVKNRIIFASDHDLLERPKVVLPLGETIERNSTGIYECKLEDLNNFEMSHLVYEAKEPSFYFRLCGTDYIFCGMRGEIAIGKDFGNYWYSSRIKTPFWSHCGQTYDYYVMNNGYILVRDNK